ncbi:MAG: QueT transporter family protein [Firmicutes bacterium]|uniref:Transporter n=1 Tax=Candidatus Colimorpha enterica TaxID=3083063 RepID=R6TVL5_9BACT|nr:QueT transporter family protein [Candidatus Colimorpha enterica]MCI5755867.1 QueT transporter family protein [Candidatus Colimorpha enterica]MDY2906151.1 QueT transporter family protein [Eubacteriales bacterium]CDC73869.1 transporter [Candidatus Colimorpha enterica]
MKKRNPFITQAALIAALYVVLTLVSAAFGLDSKAIQFRLSEVLTVLPALTPAAIPGLFIGCLLSNFICGAMLPDMIFGSLATLIGAVGTYFIGKRVKWLSALPPIAANTVIVPLVLKYAYHLDGTVPFFALTVFIGEFVCCGILGTVLLYAIPKRLAAQMK